MHEMSEYSGVPDSEPKNSSLCLSLPLSHLQLETGGVADLKLSEGWKLKGCFDAGLRMPFFRRHRAQTPGVARPGVSLARRVCG